MELLLAITIYSVSNLIKISKKLPFFIILKNQTVLKFFCETHSREYSIRTNLWVKWVHLFYIYICRYYKILCQIPTQRKRTYNTGCLCFISDGILFQMTKSRGNKEVSRHQQINYSTTKYHNVGLRKFSTINRRGTQISFGRILRVWNLCMISRKSIVTPSLTN